MSHDTDHEAEHTPEAIRERIRSGSTQGFLKDSIYGAIDGAVTTFAVVSSVTGAGLSSGIVIILGLANLLGDGFSMAAGIFWERELRTSRRAKPVARKSEKSKPIPKARKKKYGKFSQPRGSKVKPWKRS